MSLRAPVVLAPLDVNEVDDVPFDFSLALRPGETITSASLTATMERGVQDLEAYALLVGTPSIGKLGANYSFTVDASGPVVLQRLSAVGRWKGNIYCVRCVAFLSSGRILTSACHIPITRI